MPWKKTNFNDNKMQELEMNDHKMPLELRSEREEEESLLLLLFAFSIG